MTTVYDVPASELIKKVAEKLTETDCITPPEWGPYVKTGIHKELPPSDSDWWFTRCASIMRRVYIDGPVGVFRLRSYYGGRRHGDVRKARFVKGSGSIIREALKQLEKAGHISRAEGGRAISPKGRSFLDKTANEVKAELVKVVPELAKY